VQRARVANLPSDISRRSRRKISLAAPRSAASCACHLHPRSTFTRDPPSSPLSRLVGCDCRARKRKRKRERDTRGIESPRCGSKVRTDTMRQAARVGQRDRHLAAPERCALEIGNTNCPRVEREKGGEREREKTCALFPRKNHKSSPAAVRPPCRPFYPPVAARVESPKWR